MSRGRRPKSGRRGSERRGAGSGPEPGHASDPRPLDGGARPGHSVVGSDPPERVPGPPEGGHYERIAETLRGVLLAFVTALLVSRPLFASEDADRGSGLVFVQLWLAAGVLWAVWLVLRAVRRARSEALQRVAGPPEGGHYERAGPPEGGQYERSEAPPLVRFGWIDFGVAVLVIAQVAGALLVAEYRRPALNMAWEWIGLGMAFLLVRQTVRSPGEVRGIVVVLLALAAVLAVFGLYQFFWGLEDIRSGAYADWRRTLADQGILPGSPEERLFRDRLESDEPFATFGLANSLGGFLAAWLMVGMAMLVGRAGAGGSRETRRAGGRHAAGEASFGGGELGPIVGAALLLATLLACLVLTKSRTAYLGVIVGLVALVWLLGREWLRRWRRALPAGLVVIVALVIGLALAGGVDREVWRQAGLSLKYRVEYWGGTLRVIRESPLLGVGPGNFRQHYLAYKWETSSEEIADPHNLLLDVWTSGGLAAALALAFVLLRGLVLLLRRRGGALPGAESGEGSSAAPYLGGALGFVLALALGVDPAGAIGPGPIMLLLLGAGWLIAVTTLHRVLPRAVDCRMLGLGALVLVVHLLGAGGIAMPAVSLTLWVLLALGLNVAPAVGREERGLVERMVRGQKAGPAPRAALAALGVVVTAGLLITAGRALPPILRSVRELEWARIAATPRQALVHVERALAADPLNADAHEARALLGLNEWRSVAERGSFEEFVEGVVAPQRRAIALDPRNWGRRMLLGRMWMAYAQHAASAPADAAAALDAAVEAYEQAAARYPHHARNYARLAEAYWLAGREAEGDAAARRALELDRATPHASQKLPAAGGGDGTSPSREFLEARLAEDHSAERGSP